MKYSSKQIEAAIHKYVVKFGSVDKVPVKYWKPFRKDFAKDSQAMHHYFIDEDTYYWNNPLRTTRMKLYNVGKLLRESSTQKRLKILKKLGLSKSSYSNTVYQCHMCHRCYKYQAVGSDPIYASFRDELVEGIKMKNLPGPHTQATLSKVFHNNGNYQPIKHGKVIGHAQKLFIYRRIEYYPNKIALSQRKPTLTIPYQRVTKKNV